MGANPILKKLGFSDDDRVVILHADDIGMCETSVSTFDELMERGSLTSGATMVPCSWFPAAASYCRAHPEVDMGVHLTLTSEWATYRWRPTSTTDPESGLIDEAGYFFSTTEAVQQHARPDFVRAEAMSQVNQALAAGVDVSHIDMHMGAMLHPKFLPAYLEVARTQQIPMLALRMSEAELSRWNNPQLAAHVKQSLDSLEEEGFPIVDHFRQTALNEPETRLEEIRQMLETLPPGLTHFITHPAHDTPELRAITPDWAGRVADYKALVTDEFLAYLKEFHIHTISYTDLRDVVRGNKMEGTHA